jgi:hypothetical protein
LNALLHSDCTEKVPVEKLMADVEDLTAIRAEIEKRHEEAGGPGSVGPNVNSSAARILLS